MTTSVGLPRTPTLRAVIDGEPADTTSGTRDDDVLAHVDPAFVRADVVEIIRTNARPE